MSSITTLDQNWLIKNQKKEKSYFDGVIDFCNGTNGVKRVMRGLSSVTKICNEIAPSLIGKEIEKGAATTLAGVGLVGLPATTERAYRSITKITENGQIPSKRAVENAFHDVAQACSAWCKALIFLLIISPTFRRVTQVIDLGRDSADLSMSFDDYRKASSLEENSTGDLREASAYTRKYYMFRVAKAVLAVASGMFALFLLLTGIKLIPAIIAAVLSLTSTSIATYADLLKQGGKYKVIDFTNPVVI